MRIECRHGYFIFQEDVEGEVSYFADIFGFDLTYQDGFYTFPSLVNPPRYSVEGSTFLGANASKTFSGEAWDIMRANGLVYNFEIGEVMPIASVNARSTLKAAGRYFIANGLILPGCLTEEGKRVTDYAARHHRSSGSIRYSWVNYA